MGVMALLLLAGSGCVIGVYSRQEYGPGPGAMMVAEGQTLAEVIAVAGAPDKVYESGDVRILVYARYEGTQYVGAYASVKKDDVVIVFKDDRVSQPPILVSKGQATTILGFLATPVFGPAVTKEE